MSIQRYIPRILRDDGMILVDGEKYQDLKLKEYCKWEDVEPLETLLRTTVELLDDTDSLILEQLVIDIACALPPEFIIPLSELDDPEKVQKMIDNAKPD